MIVERITLIAIYRTLKQLETNEGRLYDIVLNRKTTNSIISPEAFKDLNALLSFIQKTYPYAIETKQLEVCHWYPYGVVKFWVEKNKGCNHMTCAFCKYEWRWLCGGLGNSDHWNPLNPFGCGAA